MAGWVSRLNLKRSSLIILAFLPAILGNFESEPQSASAIAPFGQQAVLYCKAGQGFFISRWEVTTTTREINSNVPFDVTILRTLGITVSSSSSNESYLIISATQTNNSIRIRCVLLDTATALIGRQSPLITTQFYGPPPPPTDLTISNFDNGQLQVVWNVSSTLPVESTFSLTVVKNNSHTGQQSNDTYSDLRNTTTLKIVSLAFCDVLYLWVRANNNAGESNRSQVVLWIPPYLPSFLPLSLTHTLSKTANRVYVSVAIKVPEVCPEYSETVFDVILENTTGTDRVWRQNALQETREQLAGDRVYILYVESNGEQLTTQQRVVTSEVQGVEVCAEEKSFFIRCIFFIDISVSGCNYVLEGVSSISDHIAGSNSQGTRVEVNDVSSYSSIIVYDASSITDISNRDIGIRVSLQNVTKCLATDVTNGGFTHSTNNISGGPGNRNPSLPLLVIVLPVAMVAETIVFIVITLTILNYCCKKCCLRTKKPQSEISGVSNERYRGQGRYCQSVTKSLHISLSCNSDGVKLNTSVLSYDPNAVVDRLAGDTIRILHSV